MNNQRGSGWTIVLLVLLGLILLVTLSAACSSYTPVKYGTVNVVTRFGKLTGVTFAPGLNWKIPFIEGTEKVRTIVLSYETSDNPDSSDADYTDYAIGAQTVDGQQIIVKYTVLFRVPTGAEAICVVGNYGNEKEIVENIVKAHSRNLARLLAQGFTAEELYGGDGIFRYQAQVKGGLVEKFTMHGCGMVLEDFLVRKIEFDPDYTQAIEQQQIAEENIQTAEYRAEQAKHDADQAENTAEGEKRAAIQKAQGEAESVRLAADAEAYSISVRGEQLRLNPEVTEWEFVKQMNAVKWGILPADSVTPFLPISPEEGVSP